MFSLLVWTKLRQHGPLHLALILQNVNPKYDHHDQHGMELKSLK